MASLSTIPVELLKLIAIHLPTTTDILSFASTCHRLHASIFTDQTVFRVLFLRTFEPPRPGSSLVPYDYITTFALRYRVLHRTLNRTSTCDYPDLPPHEPSLRNEALTVALDLVLDARPSRATPTAPATSQNLELLRAHLPQYFLHPTVTNQIPIAPVRQLLQQQFQQQRQQQLLRLLCYPLRLGPLDQRPRLPSPSVNGNPPSFSHDHDSFFLHNLLILTHHPSVPAKFASDDLTQSFPLLDPIAQLFTHHLDPNWHGVTFHQAAKLLPQELPGFWSGGKTLGELGHLAVAIPERWYGAYTYIEPSGHIEERGDYYLAEQTLEFSAPTTATEDDEAVQRTFTGSGEDFRSFRIRDGTLTSVNTAPGGVGGWKHFRCIKDYTSHSWAYDGFMLPGNNIVLGTWRDPHLELDLITGYKHGIFMFWAVPEAGPDLASRDNRLALG